LTARRKARLDRRPTGQPAKVDLLDVFNALLYINRTGIPWKYLPHDFPNHGTVYAYYAAWRDEGILAQLNYDLTGLARVKEGRKPQPTVSVIDTQSVMTSTNVPLTSQGTDTAGSTPASRTPSSNTAPASESTSKSPTETQEFAASTLSKGAGLSNEALVGSCCTGVPPETTRPCPPAPRP
jgi:transposase